MPTDDKFKDATTAFLEMLKQHGKELGEELKGDLTSVQDYVAARMANLSIAVAEPGFPEVLKAERDNVALKVASRSVMRADALDARLLAFISGALSMVSKLL